MNFQCKFLQFYSHLTSTQLGASSDWQEINIKLKQRRTTTYSHSRSPKNIFYYIFSESFHPWWQMSASHTLLLQSQMPSSLWWHPMISDDILWFLIHLCSWKLHCQLPYMTTEYICILSWHLHWQHLNISDDMTLEPLVLYYLLYQFQLPLPPLMKPFPLMVPVLQAS